MRLKRALLWSFVLATPMALPQIAVAESAVDMEEVIVTSRRKNESVQDVPLSVTVFGEEKIKQLKPATLRDFDGLAPNVYIGMNAAGPGNSTIYIRGVGYPGSEKTQSPQVAVIVDDVQMGSSTGALIDVFDVESIEINRGPQGVLFGRNTIGGNIVVNRVKPKFNEFGVNAAVSVGDYSARTIKARINIPLIDDTLALKIGAISREQDGFWDNATIGGEQGDIDFASQTIALRWAPNDDFDAILTYDRIDDNSEITPQDSLHDGDNRFVTFADKETPTSYEVDQLSLRMNWDINENMTLTSITASNSGEDDTESDFDGVFIGSTNFPIVQLHPKRPQEFDYFSQELRLAGAITDTLDFMVGYSYFDSELDYVQFTNNIIQLPAAFLGLPAGVPCAAVPGLGLRANPVIGDAFCQFPNDKSTQFAGEDVESTAFFGSLTWRPTEDLEFLAGVRRIDEEKDGRNRYVNHSTGTFDAPGQDPHDFTGAPQVPGTSYTVSDDWQDTITTASANWAFADNARAYVSYSEGFRSGGFSIRSVNAATAPYEPEEAEQIEIGLKSNWLEGALTFNLAYYQLEREGGQFISIITLPAGAIPGTNTIVNNGGTAESDGWELETAWNINENFSMLFNAGTIDVDNGAFTLPCDVIDGCGADPSGTIRNLGGGSDSRQPDKSYSMTLAYTRQVGPGILSANTGYKKVGDFLLVNTGAGPNNRLFEGDYGLWDAQIGYDLELKSGDRLNFSLYGKNLSDTEYKEQALFLGGPNAGFQGWGAPRIWAFEVTYSR
ncbi:MAG: iron complex outermembrane receptor protein [Candidatus Azotimanducaceae bacterium]|jgi:iron complex outermembrane receptor protein